MLFVNYKIGATREEVMNVLRDSDQVVNAEGYDTARGKPKMHLKEKGQRVKIRCEMTERPTKDNGFLEGTYFLGRVSEKEGRTSVKGIIITAPIYHFIFLLLFGYFIYLCFSLGGISPTPIILLVFDIFMFYGEFKKQSIIKRYIFRALKIVFKSKTENKTKKTDSV